MREDPVQPENIHLDNSLTSREEVQRLVNDMLNAVAPFFATGATIMFLFTTTVLNRTTPPVGSAGG